MNNPAGWFEIYVQDMTRARTFYEAVLDVQLARLDGTEFEMWGFPMQQAAYGASGALIRMPGTPSGANSVIVYFSCDDCAIEAGRVVQAGGKIETGKKAIGQYGFIALAVDTEGTLFGLHSMQ